MVMKGTDVCSKFLGSILLLMACAALLQAQSPGARSKGQFVPGRIIVQFNKGTDASRIADILAVEGAHEIGQIPQIGVHILQVPPGATESVYVRIFQQLPEVKFAQLDQILTPSSILPNDPYYYLQWNLPQISLPAAWSVSTGSTSLVLAIVDTGVDGTHQDLSTKMVAGWNVVDSNTNTTDISTHGTEAAGVAAAATNNGLGIAGVCWGCKIMPVRVTDDTYGSATSANIAAGITWAANHGAKVAAVGYSATDDPTVTSAAQYFVSKGGVVTMPSGNAATFDSNPDNPYVLTVGCTTSANAVCSFSNTGNNLDLVAPGMSIPATSPNNGYASVSGTSMSASMVAGVAALVLSVGPALSPAQVRGILEQTATPLPVGSTGWNSTYGYGLVNALAAVNAASGSGTSVPVINSSLTATGTINTGFGYQITATNNPTSYNATGLPAGLAVNTSTGLISGTPTVSGTFGVTISATNGAGTGSATLSLTINNSAPVITGSLTATGTINSAFSYQITATNSPTSYNATGLPSGLSVSTSTGLISGKPTVTGAFNVTISATNGAGTGSATLSLTINNSAPVITSSLTASGTVNTAFSYQITATNSPTSYNATGLPTGLSVSTSTGLISGTPTVSGTFGVTISATNGAGTGSATLSLTINAAPAADFSISASPSSENVKNGGTAQFTVTITPINGFTGTVSFSMTSSPAGPTDSFSPSTVVGSGSTTMSVPTGSFSNGFYTLTITGTSGGMVHSTSVSLHVHN